MRITALTALAFVLSLSFVAGAEDGLEHQLKRAVAKKSLDTAVEVLAKMHRQGGSERVEAVLQCLAAVPPREDVLYWLLVRGATGFVDRPGLRALGEGIIKVRRHPMARDLMFGLQGNDARGVIEPHSMVLSKGDPDLARMAAEQLANIPGEASVEVLIAGFRTQTSSGVRAAIGLALELLTDQRFGSDVELWRAWFEGGKAEGLVRGDDGRIHRKGEDVYREAEREILKTTGKVLVLTAHKTLDKPEHLKTDDDRDREHSLAYDRIEDILSSADIPVVVMDKLDFNDELPDLSGYMAIAINCSQIRPICICPDCKPGDASNFRLFRCTGCDKHTPKAFKLSSDSVRHIKRFVEKQGGYLFTEDWGVIEVLEPAWKKIVGTWPRLTEDPKTGQILGVEDFLKEQDVDVNPARGMTSNPLMRGVYAFHHANEEISDGGDEAIEEGDTRSRFRAPIAPVDSLYHEWHIDNESPAIEVRNSKAVKVLLRSEALRGKADGNDACALTFFPGKNGKGEKAPVITDGDGSDYSPGTGRVLHILSHFGKQKDVADEHAIRNLLLNFMRESAVAYQRMHPSRKK